MSGWRNRPNLLAGAGAVGWLIVVIVPLYVVVISTFKTRDQYLDNGPLGLPQDWTLANYASVFSHNFLTFLLNTALVTGTSVALVLLLAVPCGFAIVRSRSRLASAGFRMLLFGLAIPAQAAIIPVYWLMTQLSLYDALLAIILPTAAFSMPVAVLILTSSMRDVSEHIYEAAVLDGAGSTRVLLTFVVPVSRAGIATVSIYAALQAWNGFLFPLVLTQSENKRVLTMALWQFQTEYDTNVPGLLAAVTLSAVPIFIAYLLARRSLIDGLIGIGGK